MPKEGEKKEIKVDVPVMQAWNDYVNWLKEKGYSGSTNMNHRQFSDAVFNQYKKEHPETVLTNDHFLPIQQSIQNYRNNYINQLKSGSVKTDFTPAKDYLNVLQWAGTPQGQKLDGFVGQQTSQFMFPSYYMNAKTPENRVGFVRQSDGSNTIQNSSLQAMKEQPVVNAGTGIFNGTNRVAELYPQKDKTFLIKFRNENGFTGEQNVLTQEDLNRYLGTGSRFQTNDLYQELLSKSKTAAK